MPALSCHRFHIKPTPATAGRQSSAWLACTLAVSVLLHAVVFALPAGRFVAATFDAIRLARPGAGVPAPLQVRLSSRVFQPVRSGLEQQRPVDSLPPSAAAISTASPGNGGRPHEPTAGVPVPVYFANTEVTRPPAPLTEIDLEADGMRGKPGSGTLVMTLFINETGSLDRAAVETTSLGPELQAAVTRQFEAARFKPAEIDGIPVKSRMRIEVRVAPLLTP